MEFASLIQWRRFFVFEHNTLAVGPRFEACRMPIACFEVRADVADREAARISARFGIAYTFWLCED